MKNSPDGNMAFRRVFCDSYIQPTTSIGNTHFLSQTTTAYL